MELADFKNEFTFYRIFGDEKQTETLVSFLNAVLDLEEGRRIESVTILFPYQLPKLADGKAIVLDLSATDQNGDTFFVEVQVALFKNFGKYVLRQFFVPCSQQMERAKFYEKFQPLLFIGILDSVLTGADHYINRSRVQHVETSASTFRNVEFTFIELSKFQKQEEDLHTIADKWIYFIKNCENLKFIPPNIDDPGLKKAFQRADMHLWSKKELSSYDYVSMQKGTEASRISYAEKEGMREAISKGKIEGKQEYQLTVARKLIKASIDDNFIAEVTELSLDEVQALHK